MPILRVALSLGLLSVTAVSASARQAEPPRVLINLPERQVEYQLGRLTAEQLVLVERRDDDRKYRPIYAAMLTRRGVPATFRDEAVAALVKLDKSTPARVLLASLEKIPADDEVTAERVLGMLFTQPANALQAEKPAFAEAAASATAPLVRTGAYGALMIADGSAAPAWKLAAGRDGHLVDLMRGVRHLGKYPALQQELAAPVLAQSNDATNKDAMIQALATLGWTRKDASTFERLAKEVTGGADAQASRAALRSLQAFPEDAFPAAGVEPLARTIVKRVGAVPPAERTTPAVLDEIQFGERLAAAMPAEAGRAIRRDLRALGVQVVRIQALPEKLSFDLRWFVVEAGKPVQIVLFNPDAMPHNIVVGRPGSLEEIGTKGSAMPMPQDPASTVKPYVPDSPQVLFATRLVREGETERLGFNAPAAPGEYIFVCTFPGHWVRMYGVMLVVDKLEAWEAKPTPPKDPVTGKPFASQKQ